MASAFKKLNNSIKVKELEDKNIFEVNGEWTFETTKDIEFSPDAENEGFITGLLSLKGLYRNGRYMLDVTIGNHVNIFGQYFSIIDCKYDNRFSDDDSNSLQVVFADDDDFYVDLISYLEFFTSKVEIRVRGDEILACNLFMTINNLTQDEWKEVASVLKSIANSIKPKKKTSQSKKSSSKKSDTKKFGDDFIVEDTTLIKYIGNDEYIEIPDGITEIASLAFSGRTDIVSVTVPDGCMVIGDRAFENCFNLETIYLPDSLIYLGSYAFVDCHNLKGVYLSDSILHINDSTFSECYKLEDFSFPKYLKGISQFAMKNCQSIEEIVLPSGVKSIVGTTFSNCKNLTYAYIPNSVKEVEKDFMGNTPFLGCDNLVIHCKEGSYIEYFAKENNIEYETVSSPKKIKKSTLYKTPTKKRKNSIVTINDNFSFEVPEGYDYFCNYNNIKIEGTNALFIMKKGVIENNNSDYLKRFKRFFWIYEEKCNENYNPATVKFEPEELSRFVIKTDNLSVAYAILEERDFIPVVITVHGAMYSCAFLCEPKTTMEQAEKELVEFLSTFTLPGKISNAKSVKTTTSNNSGASNKAGISHSNYNFEEVDVMASRKKMLTSLDNRRNEDKPKGCDIRLVSLKEIFKDNEDLAIATDIAFNFTMGEDDKQRRKELLQKAQEFAKVFRVSPEKFDPEYDRESEIRNGYLKHIYGWAALKSLVYTGNRYAIKTKTTLFDLSIDELVALSDFIESRGGANFKIRGNGRDTWMTAIRNQFETNCLFGNWKIARFLHYFDKRFWDDKQVPLQNIIENLYDLIPVMEKIKNYVAEDKSRLNSAIAEILIAWCTFSIACKELFYITKGVDKYSLQQVGDDFIEMPKTADLVNHEEKGVVTYKNYAVAYVGESKNVTIPENIEYFIADRFEDANELTLPSSLKTAESTCGIGEFFWKLKNLVVSEGTEILGEHIFSGFSTFGTPEEIVLPKSIKSMQTHYMPSDIKYKVRYDSYALEYCKKNNLKYEIVYTPEELKEKENNDKYNNAIKDMELGQYTRALSALESIASFKDAEQKIVECKFQMESSYDKAKKEMAKKKVSAYKAAKRSLNLIRGWKDADEKYLECERKIKEHTKLLKEKTKILKELDDSTRNQNELERQQKSNKEGKTYFFLGLLFTTFFAITGFALSGFFILFAIFTAIGGILNVKSFSEYSETEHKLTEQKERTDRLRAEFNEISNKIYQLENGYDEV